MRMRNANGRTWRNGRPSESERLLAGLSPASRRTADELARINRITPAAVVGRMTRGAHLDYFPKQKQGKQFVEIGTATFAALQRVAKDNGYSTVENLLTTFANA